MTEKELRESLKSYLGPAGLPDSRKEALLRTIRAASPPANEKGETAMFRPNKFRTALVLAAIVTVLSFTVALAAGLSGYVNMKGELVPGPDELYPQILPTPVPSLTNTATEEIDYFALADEIILNAPEEYMVTVRYEEDGTSNGRGRAAMLTVESYEELAALVGDDSWMLPIPEGWEFRPGYVILSCPEGSTYELVSEETTPEGITVRMYRLPEGKGIVSRYGYGLWDEDHNIISVLMSLEVKCSDRRFLVEEGDKVETLAIPGMDEALLISAPNDVLLTARRTLQEPVSLHGIWQDSPAMIYSLIEFSIDSWGSMITTLSESELHEVILSMFDK